MRRTARTALIALAAMFALAAGAESAGEQKVYGQRLCGIPAIEPKRIWLVLTALTRHLCGMCL